ncbi:hypothetical protein [Priestia megaterium]|uniref:hypothetical protein n=1 Tax=Priestia megaterium TaxID=1404 RepID=UPI003012E875
MRFTELSKEMQLKVRMFEAHANELGKDSPECRELWLELQKEPLICGALKKKDGEFSVCLRSPVEGRDRCEFHGGKTLKGDQLTPAQKQAQLSNLRPDAHFIHGLYRDKDRDSSMWLDSLTQEEIDFSNWLEGKVRNAYTIPDDGLSEVFLSGLIADAIVHYRLLRKGKFESGSKHTAKPLFDILKACKDLGWLKNEQDNKNQAQSVALAWLDKLDSIPAPSNNNDNDKPIVN